jgi:glycosyltransferase involved in cell wall biosynthesis
VPEVTGDAAVLVPPSDEKALADAIARVLRNGELREELAARGLRRAQEFTWERAAEETVSIYRKVLEGSRNGGAELGQR